LGDLGFFMKRGGVGGNPWGRKKRASIRGLRGGGGRVVVLSILHESGGIGMNT